jgi:hypothetical protein
MAMPWPPSGEIRSLFLKFSRHPLVDDRLCLGISVRLSPSARERLQTSKWKPAEIKRGNGKLPCQRSEYAQESVRLKYEILTGKPGLQEPPSFFSVDVAQNRRSIQRLIDLQPKVVCFGHGHPLRNLDLLKRFMQNDAEKTGR